MLPLQETLIYENTTGARAPGDPRRAAHRRAAHAPGPPARPRTAPHGRTQFKYIDLLEDGMAVSQLQLYQ